MEMQQDDGRGRRGRRESTFTDMVCGAVKPVSQARGSMEYQGIRYLFCSRRCRNLFFAVGAGSGLGNANLRSPAHEGVLPRPGDVRPVWPPSRARGR